MIIMKLTLRLFSTSLMTLLPFIAFKEV
ncbi:hypothetical protein Pint_05543 [Pistacia integerrima]|uniref:Uncharacterized protein n=1 Tax=Pistacia integerrima TaxID=434235 RepID=A0ACC0Z5S8_9ROSI|nr:hypothetical protein Pint_05543 [Pistacia integerrima]